MANRLRAAPAGDFLFYDDNVDPPLPVVLFVVGSVENRISYGRTGAPPATYPDGLTPQTGDYWLRVDGGGAGATHIYYFNGSWIGIA